MSPIRQLSLFALPALVLAACGGDGAANPPGNSPPGADAAAHADVEVRDDAVGDDAGGASDAGDGATASDAPEPSDAKSRVAKFDADAAAAVCARLASCCSGADYSTYWAQYQTELYGMKTGEVPPADKCVATLESAFHKLHDRWVASIGRGRMRFDADKAEKCVRALTDAACGVPLTQALYDGSCFGNRAATFEKLAKPGDTCEDVGDGTYNGECAPDLGFCEGPSSKYPTRKCVAWRKPGDECSIMPTWQFCDTRKGSNCDGGSPTKPGKCSEYGGTIKLGASCAAATGPTNLCEAGTYCDFNSGKCAALKADGEACKYDDECKTAHAFTCLPFDPLGAGGKCGSAAFCGKGAK